MNCNHLEICEPSLCLLRPLSGFLAELSSKTMATVSSLLIQGMCSFLGI